MEHNPVSSGPNKTQSTQIKNTFGRQVLKVIASKGEEKGHLNTHTHKHRDSKEEEEKKGKKKKNNYDLTCGCAYVPMQCQLFSLQNQPQADRPSISTPPPPNITHTTLHTHAKAPDKVSFFYNLFTLS